MALFAGIFTSPKSANQRRHLLQTTVTGRELAALVEAMDGELKLVYWHENAPVSVPCFTCRAVLQERWP
jgi:cytidine deaminase